ncbi:MAG: acyclic terpene utilization AtuA family protein [Pseudomonadota bacterium]|nr:acyclic terpene utilization AtuA family protein [Pseudomonadota bacterium]
MTESIKIGGGAGFLDDRLEPALDILENSNVDFLMLEHLAERTLALLQEAKRSGKPGHVANLRHRMETLLPTAVEKKVRIVTNLGGADPIGAAKLVCDVAKEHGLNNLKVAAITGDDVTEMVRELDPVLAETGQKLSNLGTPLICANAYIGAFEMKDALDQGADVVLAGRVADPALAVAPLAHHFGWGPEDYDKLALGTMTGHMLECAGHATGGNYADGGKRVVPDLDRLGFPIAEVSDEGVIITKTHGSGGLVDRHVVRQQLLYELGDPGDYRTPDVVMDINEVEAEDLGKDRVRLSGVRGRKRPDQLKVLCGVDNGWLGVAEISYGGWNAAGRAKLAGEVVTKRLRRDKAVSNLPLRVDIIGVNSVFSFGEPNEEMLDARLRFCVRAPDKESAQAALAEAETLATNGPAGGGGKTQSLRRTIRTYATYLPREKIQPNFQMVQ